MTNEVVIAIACLVALVSVDFISSALFARRVRKIFETERSKMLQEIDKQTNRVDGLVRQYRDLVKRVKGADKLESRMDELEQHIYGDLAERIEEIDLSVLAVLDDDDDDEEYVEPAPTPVIQPVAQPRPKAQNGLAAVDAAAKKSTGNYSRYQELRDQGYSASEATAMMRNGKGGKRGK